ncbi:hypothetical protein IFM89_017154 [Coptis chinensis]|uniref:Uncharacterized protein n=1 Tax=Coptis chinensis TaxID=261450 RepID=A0A835HT30_9MAGN|nr:hypothetical protein IFM89_017154 [Coptis chinensis]
MGVHTGRDPNVKKPAWLWQRAPQGEMFLEVKESLSKLELNTVGKEAQCPNIGEGSGTLIRTFSCHRVIYVFEKEEQH